MATLDELIKQAADERQLQQEMESEGSKSSVYREFLGSTYDIYGDTLRAAAAVTGSKSLRRSADFQNRAAELERAKSELPQSFRDVRDLSSAAGYVVKGLASSAPYLPLMAAGGAGAAGAGAAAGLRTGLGVLRGVGAAGATLPAEVGSKLREQVEVGGEENIGQALTFGLPSAALNVVGAGRLAVDLGASLGRTAVRATTRGALEEGAAETGQAFLSEANKAAASPEYDYLGPQSRENLLEAAVGGAVLGGTVGGVAGSARAFMDRRTQKVQKELEAENIRIAAREREVQEVEARQAETEARQAEKARKDELRQQRLRADALKAQARQERIMSAQRDNLDITLERRGDIDRSEMMSPETVEKRKERLRKLKDTVRQRKEASEARKRDKEAQQRYQAQLAVMRGDAQPRRGQSLSVPDEVYREPIQIDQDPSVITTDIRKHLGPDYETLISDKWADNLAKLLHRSATRVNGTPIISKEFSNPETLLEALPTLQSQSNDAINAYVSTIANENNADVRFQKREALAHVIRRVDDYFNFREIELKGQIRDLADVRVARPKDGEPIVATAGSEQAPFSFLVDDAQTDVLNIANDPGTTMQVLDFLTDPKKALSTADALKNARIMLPKEVQDGKLPEPIVRYIETTIGLRELAEVPRGQDTETATKEKAEADKPEKPLSKKGKAKAPTKKAPTKKVEEAKKRAEAKKAPTKKAPTKKAPTKKAPTKKVEEAKKRAEAKKAPTKKVEEAKQPSDPKRPVTPEESRRRAQMAVDRLTPQMSKSELEASKKVLDDLADSLEQGASQLSKRRTSSKSRIKLLIDRYRKTGDEAQLVNAQTVLTNARSADTRDVQTGKDVTRDPDTEPKPKLSDAPRDYSTFRTSPTAAEVKEFVDSVTSNWRNPPPISVQNFRVLPSNEKAYLKKTGFVSDDGKLLVDGYYRADPRSGKPLVVIFNDNLRSWGNLEAVLFHEALGHYGIRRAYGKEYKDILQQAYNGNKQLRQTVESYRTRLREKVAESYDVDSPQYLTALRRPWRGMTHEQETRFLTEEAIVTLAEEKVNLSVVDKIISFVNKIARRLGITSRWTNADIRALVEGAQRSVIDGSAGSAANYREAVQSVRTQGTDIAGIDGTPESIEAAVNQLETYGNILSADARQRMQGVKNTQVREWMEDTSVTLKDLARRGKLGSLFLRHLLDKIKRDKLLKGVDRYEAYSYGQDAFVREQNEAVDKVVSRTVRLPEDRRRHVMDTLRRATLSGEWAFDPSKDAGWKSVWTDQVTVDPKSEAAREYAALSNVEKSVYRDLLLHQYKQRKAIHQELRNQIKAAGDAAIASAKGEAAKRRVENRIKADLAHSDSIFKMVKGPYMPLARFGSHVVVGRSKEMVQVEKELVKAEAVESPSDIEIAEITELRKKRTELRTDPDHYYVAFEVSAGRANARIREMAEKTSNLEFDSFRRDDTQSNLNDAPWQTIQGLRAQISAELVEGTDTGANRKMANEYKQRFNNMLDNLYLASLAETSARRHDITREGVAGASEDMLRAFIRKSRSDARFLGAMRYGGPIQQALVEMRKSTDAEAEGVQGTRRERRDAYLELIRRHSLAMDVHDTPVQDKIMLASSVWMLLTSPKYFFMNASQTGMVTLPMLAGKHGFNKSSAEIYNAYQVWGVEASKDWSAAFVNGSFDVDAMVSKKDSSKAGITDDERRMLRTVQDAGLMDIGLNAELGHYEQFGEDASVVKQQFGKVVNVMQSVARQVEVMNRVTAALAAYRLEKDKGGSHTDAVTYAKEIINDTHGDYNTLNAPRFFNALPKIVTQYRKYQAIQIALWGKMIQQAWNPQTKQERHTALAMMAFMAGQTALITGTLSLPAVSTALWVGGMLFSSEDEPVDIERSVREYIGNDRIADMILQGGFGAIGIDASGSMGFGQMLSVAPFADLDVRDRNTLWQTIGSMAGPWTGVAGGFADGYGYMREGDYSRGIELMVPVGLRNILKAYREHTGGITRRNGDVVLTPEEISDLDKFYNLLGFRTSNQSRLSADRQMIFRYTEWSRRRSSQLKKEFNAAKKANDRQGMKEAIESWNKLQDWKARVLNLNKTSVSQLYRSEMDAAKRTNRYREQLGRDPLPIQ